MRVIALTGEPPYATPAFLCSWDNDANDGRGSVFLTNDPARANQFTDIQDAMNNWRAQSKVRPFRPDGEPNRPLTAFTVEIIPAPKRKLDS